MDDEDSVGKSKGRVLFETANTHIRGQWERTNAPSVAVIHVHTLDFVSKSTPNAIIGYAKVV